MSGAILGARLALLAIIAILASCSPRPNCVTRCGVVIVGESVECDDYQRIEVELLWRIQGALPNACEAWSGLTAEALPGVESLHLGRRVEGWSDCGWGQMHFHAGFPRAWRTAYAHELVHVAQRCEAPMPIDEHRDVDHSDWTRSGLGPAVREVRNLLEAEDARR